MLKSKCLKTHYSESICMAERIIKLRQYVQFDFYTVNEMFVLQLFEKEDCANDGKDCIWEDDHFDFVMLFEQAITWCEDRYCNLKFSCRLRNVGESRKK